MMNPIYDKTKLPEVMNIIDSAAALMEEKDCQNDKDAREELLAMQEKLRDITRDKNLEIVGFRRYWASADLEEVAKGALMTPPQKEDVSDEEIKSIVIGILAHDEAEMDWWIQYLKVNTGLVNLSDYIFYPDLIGLKRDASLAEIAEKIIKDRT